MRFNCVKCVFTVLPVSAAIFIAASLVLYFYVPHFLRNQIAKSLPIVNTSESRTFINWQSIPFEIRNNLYLFNVTNPKAILKGEKPNFQQLGPFVFIEKREKRNLTWLPASNCSDNYSTVKYRQYKRWNFVPEFSNGSLSDKIHHLNVPLVSGGHSINSTIEYFGFNLAVKLTRSKLFPVHTASELLFDGYTDAFLKLAQKFHIKLPFDRFGWFYGKNNSNDGVYQIFTGRSDLRDIGKLVSWHNQTKLNIWNGKCNSLNNVFTGDVYTPFQYRTPKFLKMFVGEMCRPLKLYFTNTESIYGVAANRFMVTESSLDYSLEENQCFCPNYRKCPANGLINTGACMQNAPIGVSLPNFLYADSIYTNKISGIQKPNLNTHGFFIDIEPNLGIPVRIAVRMQINVFLENNEHLDFSKHIKQSAYYPQIWFDVSAGINETMAKQIRLLQKLPLYLNICACTMFVIGIVLTGIWVYLAIRRLGSKRNDILYDTVPINTMSDSIST